MTSPITNQVHSPERTADSSPVKFYKQIFNGLGIGSPERASSFSPPPPTPVRPLRGRRLYFSGNAENQTQRNSLSSALLERPRPRISNPPCSLNPDFGLDQEELKGDFEGPISKLQEKIDGGIFPIQFILRGKNVEITKFIEKLGQGDFGTAYLVSIEDNELGLPKQLVLKVPNVSSKNATHRSRCAAKAEKLSYIEFRNKCASQKENFEVIEFYDQTNPPCTLPEGCHISEFIPNSFPLQPSSKMIEKAQKMLIFLYGTFEKDPKTIPDVRASNLRVNANGKIVLIDPIHPDSVLEEDEKNTFKDILPGTLKTFRNLESILDPRSKV